MRRYDVISEICDAMLALGWKPYQNDHEDANGQFEMNWDYDDALSTADRHAFFKFMVKSIAEKHGLRATFMPKPFLNLTGNGCHVHVSLWRTGGKNVFADASGELGLSQLGYHFIGGMMHSRRGAVRVTNPTVNSYKRINAPPTLSGATWSPNTITYGGNNRTHMIRIPDAGRFEFRLRRRRGQPVSAAGRRARRRPRRHRAQARSGQAARHQHVHRRPHGKDAKQPAAQPARRAARVWRRRAPLKEALGEDVACAYVTLKTSGLERLLPASDRVGARRRRSTADWRCDTLLLRWRGTR